MMTNRSRTLYVGVTNNLARRVAEHKKGVGNSFTARYRIDRLVWFEEMFDIRKAIEGEKRLKGWKRARKIALVEQMNPNWQDLSEEWTAQAQPARRQTRGSKPGSN